ncbi:MAG: hypothetical protein ACERKV_06935 [Clostridiaceae bacterium]
MKKKITIKVIIILILFLSILAYIYFEYREKSISNVIHINNNICTKVIIRDERDSNKYYTIDDKKKVDEFLEKINSDIIKRQRNPQYSNGWQYTVDFYNNEKKISSIIFRNDIEISDVHYQIIKGEVTPKNIAEFMN